MKKRIWLYGLTAAMLISSCGPVSENSSSRSVPLSSEGSSQKEETTSSLSSPSSETSSSSSSVHEHTFGEWERTKEPTCTEEGIEVRTCSVCGEKEIRKVPPLGHDYHEGTIKEASCTENGEQGQICSRGDSTIVEQTIPATGHQFGGEIVVPATEDQEGYVYQECSVCHKTVVVRTLPKTTKVLYEGKMKDTNASGPSFFCNDTALVKGKSFTLTYTVKKNVPTEGDWSKTHSDYAERFLTIFSSNNKELKYVHPNANPTVGNYTALDLLKLEGGVEMNRETARTMPDYYFGVGKTFTLSFEPIGDGTNYTYRYKNGDTILQEGTIAFDQYMGVATYKFDYELEFSDVSVVSEEGDLGFCIFPGTPGMTTGEWGNYSSEVKKMETAPVAVPYVEGTLATNEGTVTKEENSSYGMDAYCLTTNAKQGDLIITPNNHEEIQGKKVHISAHGYIDNETVAYTDLQFKTPDGDWVDGQFPTGKWFRIEWDVPFDGTKAVLRYSNLHDYDGKTYTMKFAGMTFSTSKEPETRLNGNVLTQLQGANLMEGYVIKTKEGKTVVIDGGDTADASILTKYLLKLNGDLHVDDWFLTHYHSDHIAALYNLLGNNKDLHIDRLYFDFPTDLLDDYSDGRGDSDNHYAKDFPAIVAANKEKVGQVITPKQWDVYDLGGAKMKVINNAYFGTGSNFANDSSVMYKFISGDQNVLFTGDMGAHGDELLQDLNVLSECQDCPIIQLAHHGQRGISTSGYDKLPHIEVCLVPAVWWLFNNDGGTGTNTANLESFTIRSYFRDRGISHLYSQTNGDIVIR